MKNKMLETWAEPVRADYSKKGMLEFRCSVCRNYVKSHLITSGVRNRNHCPYCLWSRHLDLNWAGDRLSACKGNMKPIGLTLKRRRDKYGRQPCGELMLIHLCAECGKVSINRIAADDDGQLLLDVFQDSLTLDLPVRAQLLMSGIEPLQASDVQLVRTRLFGSN